MTRNTGRHTGNRGADPGWVDLGEDPPLSVLGEEPVEPALINGTVSWRWLGGTVLTGFTSIFLMGVALVAALNNPRELASLPVSSAAAPLASPDAVVFGEKGDRLRPIQVAVASRQVLQVSTVTRQGDRDLIKLRPFAKISTALTAPTDQVAKQIPAFDMMRVMGDGSNANASTKSAAPSVLDDQFYDQKVAGPVSVKVSDFPATATDLDPPASLSAAAAEEIVRTSAQAKGAGAPLAYIDAGPALPDPASLAVRIETENVSDIAKSDSGSDADSGVSEKVITVAQAGDLGALFQANGVTGADATKIVTAMTPLADISHLRPGQKVRLGFSIDAASQAKRLIRASIYQDGAHLATVARADDDSFVRADEPATSLDAVIAAAPPEAAPATGGGLPRIYDAVYATALQQQMPKVMVDQLIQILAFGVDLQSRIAPGDSMEVFHSLPDPDNAAASDPEILFASLTLGGVTKRFYRYRADDDGTVDYYDEQGQSAKKFLLRKPVAEAEITSGFGYRIHPILGTRILHAGIDYAAPRLTPIFAAGDGVIEQASYDANGYGNFLMIKHNNGYETLYGHQTKYADGIKVGVPVHQGQLIGYVGSTGLSTGPHVHFEIRINGTPVDPLRVRLPQGRVLSGDVLTAFQAERARIDDLLGLNAPAAAAAANAGSARPTKIAALN